MDSNDSYGWRNRPNSLTEYTVPLAMELSLQEWQDMVNACRQAGVSTASFTHDEIRHDIFVREEDKDLVEE